MKPEKATADQIVKDWIKDPLMDDRVSLFGMKVGAGDGSLALVEVSPRSWMISHYRENHEKQEIYHNRIYLRHTTLVAMRIAIDKALEFSEGRG